MTAPKWLDGWDAATKPPCRGKKRYSVCVGRYWYYTLLALWWSVAFEGVAHIVRMVSP